MTATGKTRALQALRHEQPDRVPVDFVAVPEIWEELERELHPDARAYEPLAEWMEPGRAAILDALKIDYRLLSYDMFCAPPENLVRSDARVDWWGSANRSTPNRMWRQVGEDGGHALVAECGGRVVGHLFLLFPRDSAFIGEEMRRHGYVSELFVREDSRGRGVGTALLAEAERIATARGVRRLKIGVLVGNDGAAVLYRRAGFSPYAVDLVKRIGPEQ